MKRTFTFLLVLIASFTNGIAQQYGWTNIAGNLPDFPCDTMIINNDEDTVIASLRALCFISDDEGWLTTATLDTGVILHTTDGGESWQIQTLPFAENICAIEMITPLKGYAASHENSIFRTSDGGNTWEFHGSTFALSLADMDFPPNSDTGYACGQNGALFRITPEGIEDIYTGSVSNKNAIHFISPNQGWVCGESVVQEYRNGVWGAGHAYPSGFWHDIFFVDSLHGWGVGFWLNSWDSIFVVNTVNDSSWMPQLTNLGNIALYKIFFLDNQKGWITGVRGEIFSTVNGGQSWIREAEGLSNEILSGLQFTSATNGYVCGNNMTLLKYGHHSSIEEKPELEFKVFPVPAGSQLKIETYGLQGKECIIDIIDVFGNVVWILYEGKLPSDNMEFDIQQLPAGLYFIRATASKRIISEKFIKIDR